MTNMQTLKSLQLETADLPCPLCDSTDFELLSTHDRHLLGLHTAGCRGCGLLQTNPRPTSASLDRFYARHYRHFYQGVEQPSDAYVANHHKDVRLRYTVEHLQRTLLSDGASSMLDYGCGEGSLFIALRQAGFEGRLIGIEPNLEFGRFAALHGRAEVHSQLGNVGVVDVLVINHVLEHIPEPISLLKTLKGHLTPHGCLYIDVPDAQAYASVGDLHIAHLFHFTERTLARLVEAAGYEVQSCERHAPPHHPRSIRLKAVVGRPDETTVTSAAGEAVAWNAVRGAERSAWKWVLMKRMAAIPLARSAYHRLTGRRSRSASG
jgi:2-polyprenyl-3-methyl-5-hydroxy-6-metoxy-1,4-benzoquinol methylase